MQQYGIFSFFISIGTLFCLNIYADMGSEGNVGGGVAPLSESEEKVLQETPWETFQAPISEKKVQDPLGQKWTVFEDKLGNSWAVNEKGELKILKTAPRPSSADKTPAPSNSPIELQKKKEQSNASSRPNDALDAQDELSREDVKPKP